MDTTITPGPPNAPPIMARLVARPRFLRNHRATMIVQDTLCEAPPIPIEARRNAGVEQPDVARKTDKHHACTGDDDSRQYHFPWADFVHEVPNYRRQEARLYLSQREGARKNSAGDAEFTEDGKEEDRKALPKCDGKVGVEEDAGADDIPAIEDTATLF